MLSDLCFLLQMLQLSPSGEFSQSFCAAVFTEFSRRRFHRVFTEFLHRRFHRVFTEFLRRRFHRVFTEFLRRRFHRVFAPPFSQIIDGKTVWILTFAKSQDIHLFW